MTWPTLEKILLNNQIQNDSINIQQRPFLDHGFWPQFSTVLWLRPGILGTRLTKMTREQDRPHPAQDRPILPRNDPILGRMGSVLGRMGSVLLPGHFGKAGAQDAPAAATAEWRTGARHNSPEMVAAANQIE